MEEIRENNSNENNLKDVIKDTQMLIRNTMIHQKKFSREIHSKIKKNKYLFYILNLKYKKL